MSLIVSLIPPLPKFVSPLRHLGDCHLCSLLLKIKILEPPLTSFFYPSPHYKAKTKPGQFAKRLRAPSPPSCSRRFPAAFPLSAS